MSRTLTLRGLDIPSVHKFGIGFDTIFDEIMRLNEHQNTNYPPYNILQQSEVDYIIELAVAGFSEGEIGITLSNNILKVSGAAAKDGIGTYLHRGISQRDFEREFQLAEHIEVVSAEQKNGILSICLHKNVPEQATPKSIAINHLK